MSWLSDLARPEIRALKAYQHASWEPGLVRLHANELPWRAPLDESEAGLNRYPEPHPLELAARLAALYGVGADWVLPGRGSDEAIDLLTRAYCRAEHDAVLITPPTFGMYSVAARIQGASVIEVPLRREYDFAPELPAILAALTPQAKLVYLCSPNNPTGNLFDRATVLSLADQLAGRALLVLDEAYVEFSGEPSLVSELASHPALIVLRTLSKAYGLAGARCGTLLAQPEVIALLRKVIQPYAVTQLSIESIFRTLQPGPLSIAGQRVADIMAQRALLATALAAQRGTLRVWPSAANFLLVDFADATAALERTRTAGFLLRDMRTHPALQSALRLSVGSPAQNERLIASLS